MQLGMTNTTFHCNKSFKGVHAELRNWKCKLVNRYINFGTEIQYQQKYKKLVISDMGE